MRLLRDTGVLLLAAAIPALVAAWFHPELRGSDRMPLRRYEITVATALEWGSAVVWLDARNFDRFTRQHVPGAMWFTVEDWEERLPTLLENWHSGMHIVVYCEGGGCDLSEQLAMRLRTEGGLSDVYFLHGGWDAWQARHR